jgi:hypothetical protein
MGTQPKPDWEYADRSLLAIPSSLRIEEHGRSLLSRALVQGHAIAFIGVGVSMAYGRLSWGDLVMALKDCAMDRFRKLETETVKAGPVVPRALEMTKELLEQHSENVGDARNYLVLFQWARQVIDGVNAVQAYRERSQSFDDLVSDLIRDDRGHAEKLYTEGFALGTHPNCKDARSAEYLAELIDVLTNESVPRGLEEVVRGLKAFNTARLPPTSRFASASAGHLLKFLGKGPAQPAWDDRPPADKSALWLPATDRDPLQILYRNGIHRFLTTNFDYEIERLFRRHRLAYAEDPLWERTRREPLARSWQRLIFDRHRVGDLLAFAARAMRRTAEVVYLHGRAGDSQPGPRAEIPRGITVSTGDYQHRYFGKDDRRPGMEDALGAAFGTRPILFVGCGMGEDDLLRPLREFVGDQLPDPGRLAVALLPATKPNKDIELEKARLLQTFGVYALHFGFGEEAPGTEEAPTAERKEPWLYQLGESVKAMKGFLAHPDPGRESRAVYAAPASSSRSKAKALLAALETVLAKKRVAVRVAGGPAALREMQAFLAALDSDIGKDRHAAKTAGVSAALRKTRGYLTALDRDLRKKRDAVKAAQVPPSLKKLDGQPTQDNEKLDGQAARKNELCIQAEVELVTAIHSLIVDEANESLFQQGDEEQGNSLRKALEIALDGCQNSITSAFLCARLIRAEEDRGRWRDKWLDLPEQEPPEKVVRSALAKKIDEPYFRHAVLLNGRFKQQGISQSFDHLIGSLGSLPMRPPTGRRIFLLVSRRGGGKGQLFSSLKDNARRTSLLEALGKPKGDKWPCAFFNCTLSHEVSGSVEI